MIVFLTKVTRLQLSKKPSMLAKHSRSYHLLNLDLENKDLELEAISQKGLILLAVDLVRLSSKGQIQKAFLIAGDGDYVPVVKAAKDEGVSVKLYHSGAF